jgi:ribA/ribD-fused uncharacterized protein
MLQQKINESKDKKEIQDYRREIYQIDKKLGELKNVDIIDYVKSDYDRFSKIKPIMYALDNGREFVQSVIKDEEFQKFLNEIPSKNPIKKSLFHEILDHLIAIIDKYIGIKKGSLLEEALESSLKLIQIYPENYKTNISEAPIIITSEEKINIYAGTNENAELSNFANRPFTIKGREANGLGDIHYDSVEQAFQYYKTFYAKSNSSTIGSKILKSKMGSTLKALGKQIDLDSNTWDKVSSKIMKNLILESFKQNSNALQKLLDTGNAILTHNQDKGKWGIEFPKLLMEVREELKGTNENFDIGLPTIEETLKQFGEIDREGNKKRLEVKTKDSDNNKNYRLMMIRALNINQGQSFYKASVIKIISNNKEFFTISLENRNNLLTFEERYNSIPDSLVNKYVKNCR